MLHQLFAQTYDYTTTSDPTGGGAAIFGGAMLLFWLAVAVLFIVAMWRVFTKAGKPGWASLIPFYNVYVLLQIAGRPGWWLLLFLVPFLNVLVSLVVAADLAKKFGKSAVWGVVLCGILGIGYLILAFDKSTYNASAPLSVNV
jgi:uncharacterized membrane protein YhaH (DUF805 family)